MKVNEIKVLQHVILGKFVIFHEISLDFIKLFNNAFHLVKVQKFYAKYC
jgi:hypothetical protein